jgi:hypothetical protein
MPDRRPYSTSPQGVDQLLNFLVGVVKPEPVTPRIPMGSAPSEYASRPWDVLLDALDLGGNMALNASVGGDDLFTKGGPKMLSAVNRSEKLKGVLDELLGFAKDRSKQKGFSELGYKGAIKVRVTFPDGTSMVDEIKGATPSHALEAAHRNWQGAKIEPLGIVEGPSFSVIQGGKKPLSEMGLEELMDRLKSLEKGGGLPEQYPKKGAFAGVFSDPLEDEVTRRARKAQAGELEAIKKEVQSRERESVQTMSDLLRDFLEQQRGAKSRLEEAKNRLIERGSHGFQEAAKVSRGEASDAFQQLMETDEMLLDLMSEITGKPYKRPLSKKQADEFATMVRELGYEDLLK